MKPWMVALFLLVTILVIWISAVTIPALKDNTELVKHNIGWAVGGTVGVLLISIFLVRTKDDEPLISLKINGEGSKEEESEEGKD